MKHVQFLFILAFSATVFCSVSVSAQSRFFEKYKNDEAFTLVNISPKLLQLFSNTDEGEAAVLSKLKSINILVFDEEENPGTRLQPLELYAEASREIDRGMDELMTVRDGDDDIRFLVREQGDLIERLVLLVGSPGEFVLIDIAGLFSFKDISEISGSVDGLEALDMVNEVKE